MVRGIHGNNSNSLVPIFCIIQLFWNWDMTFNTHILKEKRFNFVHSFQGFTPWDVGSKGERSWQRSVMKQSCLVHGGQKAEQGESAREEGTSHGSQGHLPHPSWHTLKVLHHPTGDSQINQVYAPHLLPQGWIVHSNEYHSSIQI